MKNLNIKDIIYIVMIVVGIVSSYFAGQMKQSNELANLHYIVKDNERVIAVNKTKIATAEADRNKIYENQIKQNEKNEKIYELVYSLCGNN